MKVIIGEKSFLQIENPIVEWIFYHYPELTEEVPFHIEEKFDIFYEFFKSNGKYYWIKDNKFDRSDNRFIEAYESVAGKLKEPIKIVEIPDKTEYEIYSWDGGGESIHEKHRIWY